MSAIEQVRKLDGPSKLKSAVLLYGDDQMCGDDQQREDAEKAAQEYLDLLARVAELDKYIERVSRLESIIQAARSGEYDNAHDITAIRKFLAASMTEYYEFLQGVK